MQTTNTLKTFARYCLAVAGFAFSLHAQQGTNRTLSITGGAIAAQHGTGFIYTLTGTATLSGINGNGTFLASGALATLAGATGSDPINGVATLFYPNGDALLGRLSLPAGYIVPALGQPTTNSATLVITGGSGAFANAAGTFATLPLTVTITGANSANVTATGSTTLYTPALRTTGTLSFAGSLGHLASGGGWKTIITAVNSGTTPAQIQLRFYDDAGQTLSLPVTVPQTIPAGSSISVSTSSDGSLQTGSAQLWTDGNVSAYIVFQYAPTGQEAAVPLQVATSGIYSIPFDNTNGLATGIAVSNVTSLNLTVPITVKDENGAVLATANQPLPPLGHTSFVISERYAAAAGKRGVIEFTTPAGGQISPIGIRAAASGAFTTIPPIAVTR